MMCLVIILELLHVLFNSSFFLDFKGLCCFVNNIK
jgi:hypothetical protein